MNIMENFYIYLYYKQNILVQEQTPTEEFQEFTRDVRYPECMIVRNSMAKEGPDLSKMSLVNKKGSTHTCRENCLLCSEVAQLEKQGWQETLRQAKGGASDLQRSYASAIITMVNTSAEDVTIQTRTLVAVASPYEEGLESEKRETAKVRSVGLNSKQQREHIGHQNGKVPDALRDKLAHLSHTEREGLEPVIMEYQDLFKKPTDGKVPCTTFGEHEIRTGDAKPVKRQQYRRPYALREEMRRQLDEMKERGVITEAISDWSAPVILVTKQSVHQQPRYRFCADFRGLNAVTQIPVHPMPLVQENIDRLSGNKYFTLVDMENAYYHIPIREQNRHKTGIIPLYSSAQ
jgi:hypothetical protein